LTKIYTVLEEAEAAYHAELEFEEALRQAANKEMQAKKERVNQILKEERSKQEYLQNTQNKWSIQMPINFEGL
jgi:hypothetical protein